MDETEGVEGEGQAEHGYDLLNNVSDAQTIYADGCIFVSTIGNAVRISFVETILEPANGPKPGLKTRHVANVVMPQDGFANTLKYMNSVVRHWAETEIAQLAILNENVDGEAPSD